MEANPTLDQLKVFLAVAEEGNFSAASRKLNRAQSVISYTIANLETQLDLRLFDRAGTRRPRLTAAGRALLEDARRIAADLQLLRARASGFNQGLESRLAVAVDALFPMPVVTAVLRAFRDAFPATAIRLYTGSLGAASELLLSRKADIGIAGEAASRRDDVVSRKIGQQPMVPVAAPDHPLALADPPVPAFMVREHFQIVIADPTDRTSGRDFHVYAFDTWRVTDAASKHALIVGGLGWGGLPVWMIKDDVAGGRLVELSLEPYPPSSYSLFAMRAADTPFGPAGSWLVERFRDEMEAFGTPTT
jgi:DNA-binding transcriptional LysR family regulator